MFEEALGSMLVALIPSAVEYAKDDIVWTEPRDVPRKDLAAASLAQLGLGGQDGKPPFVLYSDGSVERFGAGRTTAELANAANLPSNGRPN